MSKKRSIALLIYVLIISLSFSPVYAFNTYNQLTSAVLSPWFTMMIIAGLLMFTAYLTRKKRWWLSFYLSSSITVFLTIISFFLITGYDTSVMAVEAKSIAYVSNILGIPTSFLPPNAFIFPDPTGWSVFGIGFECSSIIEISVLISLLMFYPGYSWKRKVRYMLIGATATYAANIIRMMSIIYIVNIFGKSWVYVAHAIIGKLIFFAFVVILYWYLLTKPTLEIVRNNIKSGKFEI